MDLGVLAPDGGDAFLLGIACDGPPYHTSPTARDRDRLRDEILERRYGWRIFRIWAPEWVRHRAAVLSRLRDALDEARLRPVPAPAPVPAREPEVVKTPVPVVPARAPVDERFGFRYETLPLRPRERTYAFHSGAAWDDHREALGRLVETEGPIHVEQALTRLRTAWKLKRAGGRIWETFERVVDSLAAEGKLVVRRDGDDRYLWPAGRMPDLPRWPDDEGERRPLEWIAPEEIVAAIAQVVDATAGISEDDLLRATARYFGWLQLSEAMRPRLATLLGQAEKAGRIRRRGQDLVPP